MTEKDFWVGLEFRLCHEFRYMPARWQRRFWCDGFLPDTYLLNDPEPRITGKAWICIGQEQFYWDFTLFLPRSCDSRDEIDWAALIPPDNVTRWLGIDIQRRRVEIEPAVAVPDLDPPVIEPPRLPRWSP